MGIQPHQATFSNTVQPIIGNDVTYGERVEGQSFNLFLSLFDAMAHSPATHEELEKMNLAAVFNQLHAEVTE